MIKTIKVERTKLISELKDARQKIIGQKKETPKAENTHVKQAEQYFKLLKDSFESKNYIEAYRYTNLFINYVYNAAYPPVQNENTSIQVSDYDKYIAMLELSKDKNITITDYDYQNYFITPFK